MTEVAVWDIAALPPRQQFEYWHDVICRAFVPLTPHRTVDEVGFTARVETRPLAGLNRARLRARPQRTDHGPREIARTDGALLLRQPAARGPLPHHRGPRHHRRRARASSSWSTPPSRTSSTSTSPGRCSPTGCPTPRSTEVLRGRRPALGRPSTRSGAGAAVPALMTALWSLEPTTPGAGDLTAPSPRPSRRRRRRRATRPRTRRRVPASPAPRCWPTSTRTSATAT